ncbi:type II toxin-antitoxin system VapC family toxin [Sandarakinorhabdus sp.]|uniref:type II toxin-antitoxin system VapC family toxin n=1 Tax=Sandarakinorhabdus sp. TaxID=1916663 RepID=UPI003F6FE3E2
MAVVHYLDASVLVPAFVTEDHSSAVSDWLANLPATAEISDFAAGEFASAIARRVRMGQLPAVAANRLLADFDAWRMVIGTSRNIDSADIAAATALVRRFELKLRLPDAIHLALCQWRGFTLATLDDGLAEVARTIGVAHICPA